MVVAVVVSDAHDRGAGGVALVRGIAHVACRTSVAHSASAGAPRDEVAADGRRVVVAVRRLRADNGLAARVAVVVARTGVTSSPSVARPASALAASHAGPADGRRVGAAVRCNRADDGQARRVALVVQGTRLAGRARVAREAVACASGQHVARRVPCVRVAVSRGRALNQCAHWVVFVVLRAAVALLASVASRTSTRAAAYKGPAHSRSVVAAVVAARAQGLRARWVAVVVAVAALAQLASEAGKARALASNKDSAAHSRSVVVAVAHRALNRGARRVVLEAGSAHAAVLSTEAGGARADAVGGWGAADGGRVTVAVVRDAAGGFDAGRVVFEVGSALVARCSSKAGSACACAASHEVAAHRGRVIAAVTVRVAWHGRARWVALVVRRALIAGEASVASRTCACAAGHEIAADTRCVAVAVCVVAQDRLARWVSGVVRRAAVAGEASVASRARACAAGHEIAADTRCVAVAVCVVAQDRLARWVSGVVRRAAVAGEASVASRARACAAGHEIAADARCVAVAVRRIVAQDRHARWVSGIVCRAAVAGEASVASRARACAAGHEIAADARCVAVAVRRIVARDRLARWVSGRQAEAKGGQKTQATPRPSPCCVPPCHAPRPPRSSYC